MWIVDNFVDKLWITCKWTLAYSNDIEDQYIALRYIIAIWHIASKLQKWKKYKLYCYIAIMGRSLHFRADSRNPGTAHLFYPHVTFKNQISRKSPKPLRYPLRANSLKSIIFITFHTTKNHQYHTKNPFKPLKNQRFLELNRKSHI